MVGELPDPEPAAGEVRVRVAVAGVNPRDVKRRGGVGDRVMVDPRVIPGDDGAGVIDRVGAGVSPSRVGERVWVHSATFTGAFGTSADYVVVPAHHAVPLPANAGFEIGACLGVPALTAHRAVFADGPVTGLTVLVTGGAGAVGHYAIEFARLGGATVIATASSPAKRQAARAAGAHHVVDYRRSDAAELIRAATGGRGVDRVVDVAFGANLPLTTEVVAQNAVIATYASDAEPWPNIPFYRLMRCGIAIRTVFVFAMPQEAMERACGEITGLLEQGSLTHPIAARFRLEDCAEAHVCLERRAVIGKILVDLQAPREGEC
ncbi:NADPH:quinone reductase [Amycolatopsis plumensis]|uniref:NADPH:quinone reductase n=1 Tax=Amycolatopsis plumensis TaxID=236508 RepID=UPI00361C00C6